MISSQNGPEQAKTSRHRRPLAVAAIAIAALVIPAVTTLSPTLAATTTAATTTAAPADPSSLVYTAVSPFRICDTRSGNPSKLTGEAAQCNGKTLSAGGSITVDMPTDVVPADAQAAVLSVAVTNAVGTGFITVWPAGATNPMTSNLDYTHGQTISNTVTVELGTDSATKDVAVSIYNGPPNGTGGPADVIVDLEGYYAPQSTTSPTAGEFHAVTPTRIADTRCGRSPNGAGASCSTEAIPSANDSLNFLTPGSSINVQVAGLGGVPATGASAVVLNVTLTNAFGSGYIAAYPTGSANPATASTPFSNQQYAFGNTLSTKVLVPLSSNGQVSIFDGPAKGGGNVDILVDVDGYFSSASGATGSFFVPVTPVRLLDNRVTDSPLAPGSSEQLGITGANGVPTGASAAVLNVTDVPTDGNYLTVYPDDQALPTASDVNYVKSDAYDVLPNAAYAELGSDGGIKIYNGPPDTSNNAASTFVVVDLFGYFTSSPSTANTITLSASPRAIPVNLGGSTSSTSTLTATVTSSSGSPVSGDTVTFVGAAYPASAACGSFTPSNGTATTGSNGAATITYTAGSTSGFCFLAASESQNGKQATTAVDQELSPVPSPVYTVAVSASPTSIAANGSSTSTVTVTVTNGSNPIADDPVLLSAFGSPAGACGSLSASTVTTGSNGTATATYTSSSTVGTCTIGALEANSDQSASAVITQTGPKNTIVVTPASSSVLLGTSDVITATVTNASGADVSGDVITFSLGGDCILGIIPTCSLSPTTATTNASGVATTTLSGLGVIGSATVTAADSSGASGSTTVSVVVQL